MIINIIRKYNILQLTSRALGISNDGATEDSSRSSLPAPKSGAVDSRPLVSSFMIKILKIINIIINPKIVHQKPKNSLKNYCRFNKFIGNDFILKILTPSNNLSKQKDN